jgi:hypothetical protein
MPGYDFARGPDAGKLPWSWARERLERARNYWLSTVSADGRPHAMPVWGVWHDERFFFSASPASRRIRNLARSPGVVVTTESAVEGVVLEGAWSELRPGAELDRFAAAYDRKYDWDIRAQAGGGHYLVTPSKAFAVLEHESGRTTRWTFE